MILKFTKNIKLPNNILNDRYFLNYWTVKSTSKAKYLSNITQYLNLVIHLKRICNIFLIYHIINFIIRNNILLYFNSNYFTEYNLQKLTYIKTKLSCFKNLYIFYNCHILNYNFTSINYLSNFIKKELKKNIPIKKIFNTISFKLLNTKTSIEGIKIIIKGRINKSDKSITELFLYGKFLNKEYIPIKFFKTFCISKYGILGIKIWFS